MRRDIEQLQDPWKDLLQQAGIAQVWTWQAEALQAWTTDGSVLACFPQGGGRGLCALLMAQQAPAQTLIVCSSQALAEYRREQAEELGWSVTLWDGADTPPEASTQPVLTWAEALASREDLGQQSQAVQHVILDGLPSTEKLPRWWQGLTSLPKRWVFPADAMETSWWTQATAGESWQTLQIGPEAHKLTWEAWQDEWSDATTWFVGLTPEQAQEGWVTVPNDAQARRQERETWQDSDIRVFHLEAGSPPPFALPNPAQVRLGEMPPSLAYLGILARRCSQVMLPPQSASQQTSASADSQEIRSAVKQWLAEQAHPNQATTLYISLGDLLQQLGQPVTPQPEFERGAKQLEQTLRQLSEEGFLQDLQEVSFHVKIHSIGRFQPKALQDIPELLAFWEAYEQMRQGLSPLDSLKLTFFNGRSFDLRLFSERLPYRVADLNELFKQLQERNLAIVALGANPHHQRFDREYQLTLPAHFPQSPALPYWRQSGAYRTPLLWSALATTPTPEDQQRQALLAQSPNTVAFWQTASQLIQQTQAQDRLTPWAGRLLQLLEKQDHGALLTLWAITAQALEIPGISTAQLLPLLPPAHEVPDALVSTLQPLLREHLAQDTPPQELYEYALHLPATFGFDALIEGYLQQEANNILSLHAAETNTATLQRYVTLAQKQVQLSLTSSDEASEAAEAAEASGSAADSTADTELAPRPWSMAVGWAYHLVGQSQQAWLWVAGATPTTSQEALRGVAIALNAKQPEVALRWLSSSEAGDMIASSLLSDLYQQLFAICKAQARCKACSLQATAFCPAGLDNLLALADQRPEMPSENYQYSLAKRIRADLEGNTSEQLREVLNTQVGQQSDRVQRAILTQLAQRNEAGADDLRRLADWAEAHGDYRKAQKYRETIQGTDPSDAQNLQKLADLHLRQDEIVSSLRLALEATHNHPRRYPLEPWIQRHHQRLFAAPEMLRQALLELPAHPALSKLEEELTTHENLLKQLQPQLEKAEAAMSEENWGAAKAIAEQVLNQYPEQAPARLQQILQDVKQHERKFWQTLQRLPRHPKKRNQLLEGVATDAMKHGLEEVADAAYRKLLRLSPQYGLGYLKWARITSDPAKRDEAYQKAISLSRTPQQTQNNLEEYLRCLEQTNDLARALPMLLQFAKAEEETVPQAMLEKIFLRLARQYGTQEDVISPMQEFVDTHEQGKTYKRLQRALTRQESMEPWKRALLSIKNQQ